VTRKKQDPDQPVIIIRSGYATEALWLASIDQALDHGRAVIAIDASGHKVDPRFLINETFTW
jgi:hypothetical protein